MYGTLRYGCVTLNLSRRLNKYYLKSIAIVYQCNEFADAVSDIDVISLVWKTYEQDSNEN
ncbi:CLUMA_CG003085, isoform A [Clunio marinus]|uniref:CLUMA_CG003085, isoform A n=1 Tax=Clunio marinus TaxID=568069 RepID=A0A1J1HS76_9DIPT|nr:CLUMA_CG003085, isoform A [Clunio marinus]